MKGTGCYRSFLEITFISTRKNYIMSNNFLWLLSFFQEKEINQTRHVKRLEIKVRVGIVA
jgi:hypothetical protein